MVGALAAASCGPWLPAELGPAAPLAAAARQTPFEEARMRMVEEHLRGRDITDERVLDTMLRVPREEFVPPDQRPYAHDDRPLRIGYRQTISQPYIVAFMTQALALDPGARVLEVGTGSGYQTAVLAELVDTVYSIEIVPELATRSRELLTRLRYGNVRLREGDGYAGWPNAAPFDAIMVTAAPDHVPQPLLDQLALDGRMIIPVGDDRQMLTVFTRTTNGIARSEILPVLFVPMTGEAQR